MLRAGFRDFRERSGQPPGDVPEIGGLLPAQVGRAVAEDIKLGRTRRKRRGGDVFREEFRLPGGRFGIRGNLIEDGGRSLGNE